MFFFEVDDDVFSIESKYVRRVFKKVEKALKFDLVQEPLIFYFLKGGESMSANNSEN